MNNKSDSAAAYKPKFSFKNLLKDQRFLLFLVTIALGVIVTIINPRFIKVNNLVLILQQISVWGTLTMGMAILMLGGGIDLSIGSIMALVGCVIAVLVTTTQGVQASATAVSDVVEKVDAGLTSLPVAVLIGLAVGLLCGFLNGFIIAKTKCAPLIITLGMSSVYNGIALVITGGQYMSFNLAFEGIRLIRIGDLVPFTLIWFLVIVVLVYILMNKTKFGRRVIAMGGNEENARLCGINVDFYKIATYVITGFLCFVAAIIYSTRLDSVTANAGAGYETKALTGSIIGGITFDGGKGSIGGAFLGAVFMGILSNAMNVLAVDANMQVLVSGVVIVGAVVLSNLDNLRKK